MRVEEALIEAGISFSLAAVQVDGQVRIDTDFGVGMSFIVAEPGSSTPGGLEALGCWRWELLNKGDDA